MNKRKHKKWAERTEVRRGHTLYENRNGVAGPKTREGTSVVARENDGLGRWQCERISDGADAAATNDSRQRVKATGVAAEPGSTLATTQRQNIMTYQKEIGVSTCQTQDQLWSQEAMNKTLNDNVTKLRDESKTLKDTLKTANPTTEMKHKYETTSAKL